MKKYTHPSPLSVSYSEWRVLSDDGLQTYLDRFHWYDTREQLSADTIRQMLKESLGSYFRGAISQDFIIGLASQLYDEAMGTEDNDLIGMTCDIEKFGYARVNNRRVNYAEEEVKDVFRQTLERLIDLPVVVEICYNRAMEIDQIKVILSELLRLAKGFEVINRLDSNLPLFTVALTAIARRDFPILHSIALLSHDPLSGDAILDLSRRVFEDMISVEFMIIKGKEKMAEKFIKYSAVERWLDLEYLKSMGVQEDPNLEKEVENDFQRVKPQFIYKKDQIAQSWSSTKFELMIEELIKAKKANSGETVNLLQGYILGNRKNHLSSRDTGAFLDNAQRQSELNHSLRVGLVIAVVSYIRILSNYAQETGNGDLADQMDKLFSKLNVPTGSGT